MGVTTIEWTASRRADGTWTPGYTFNPWRGCTKVSPGCAHCYAEKLSRRNPGVLGVWGDNGTRVVASEAAWREPLKWDRAAREAGERRRVFCASMADVFEDRPELVEPRIRLRWLMYETPNLDWLLLTKRPDVAARWFADYLMPENAWIGASVEDQARADERIPILLGIPAPVRFLSIEPLLGPIYLGALRCGHIFDSEGAPYYNALRGASWWGGTGEHGCHGPAIDWVIVGGESGPNARPMHPGWALSIRDQCVSAGVPFFFKQWGEWLPDCQKAEGWVSAIQGKAIARLDHAGRDLAGEWGLHDESDIITRRVGKHAAGRRLDGREWSEFPIPTEAAR